MLNPQPITTTELYNVSSFCFRSPAERNAHFNKFAVVAKIRHEENGQVFQVPVILRNRNRSFPQGMTLDPRAAKLFDTKEQADRFAAKSPEVTKILCVRDLYIFTYRSPHGYDICYLNDEQFKNKAARKKFLEDIVKTEVTFCGRYYDWDGKPYTNGHGTLRSMHYRPQACNGLSVVQLSASLDPVSVAERTIKNWVHQTHQHIKEAADVVDILANIELALSENK